jgi:head-tail adaptor
VLEGPDRVPDGAGGFREAWRPLGELWAEIRPGLGREVRQDFAVIAAMHYRVVVRAAPYGAPSRPRPEQRLREGARVLRIVAVGEHDPEGRYLTCFAYEEVAA